MLLMIPADSPWSYSDILRMLVMPEINPLPKEDNVFNRAVSSWRVVNEHIIGCLKRFRIISDTYRNRRNRFGLRFNLIAPITTLTFFI
jgi:hypothetical protein